MTQARSRFSAFAAGEGSGRPPVWFMRQAGRYMPQYQAIRRDHSFVEMCTDSDLAFEISLQPWREFGMDAVIVFYDILFLPEAMGAPLEYTERGPVFHRSVRTREDVRGLKELGPGDGSAPLLETLRRLRAELPPETALLGFAGAPFTLASYLVEGDFRRSGDRIRRMIRSDPEVLRELLDRLTDATAGYVLEQVEAGAEAIQLFDTWAGLLDEETYRAFALPYVQRVFQGLEPTGVPRILYANGGGHLLRAMAESGATVHSIDWRTPLAHARGVLGSGVGIQGNLDPAALFAPVEDVRRSAERILESMAGDPAYIFNLGHGILPETPVESVRALVETVHGFGS